MLNDIGQGFKWRPGTFDGAISSKEVFRKGLILLLKDIANCMQNES
jgi:hypothetical protein